MPIFANEKHYQYAVEEVKDVHLYDDEQFVTDPDTIISLAYRDSINEKLGYMKAELNTEARVVVLPGINLTHPKIFLQSLFDCWALEKPNESKYGLLFFAVYSEKKSYIYTITGKRLERVLPDDSMSLIHYVTMLPKYREEGIGAAIYAGVDECIRMLEVYKSEQKVEKNIHKCIISTSSHRGWLSIALVGLLVVIVTLIFYLRKKKRS